MHPFFPHITHLNGTVTSICHIQSGSRIVHALVRCLVDGNACDLTQHFYPKFTIANAIASNSETIRTEPPRRVDKSWRVQCMQKYQSTLSTLLYPGRYPFDIQTLEFVVKVFNIDRDNLAPWFQKIDDPFAPQLLHPCRWRSAEGHATVNADYMPDFSIRGLHWTRGTGSDYTVRVVVQRDYQSVCCNVVIAMNIIALLGLLAFFAGTDSYIDQLMTAITAVLVMVAFKIQMGESLPETPTPSDIEKYIRSFAHSWKLVQLCKHALMLVFGHSRQAGSC